MNTRFWKWGLLLALLVMILPAGGAFAQDDTTEVDTLPSSFLLNGFTYHAQTWNNCGPATLTMALSYYGYVDNQARAAAWLKPNFEDKNVSPWQMAEFVNSQVPELPVFSMVRYGGTLDTLRTLIANGFPTIIESGYDPERANQGWMGHYLLVIGYDDAREVFITHDSYDGANLQYSYEHIAEYWQHFNYMYMPVYTANTESALNDLLGDDADSFVNVVNTFNLAQAEATADQTDAFAWFNMGSALTMLEMYEDAATAYDVARNLGLPWRMLWYQFGPYEAYNAVGQYDVTISLATAILNDGGGQYVEETYYYAAIAREGLGQTQRAIDNYNAVLAFNPNFTQARERLNALQNS